MTNRPRAPGCVGCWRRIGCRRGRGSRRCARSPRPGRAFRPRHPRHRNARLQRPATGRGLAPARAALPDLSTAHTEHALRRLFELGALDYLHKPYLPERLGHGTAARARAARFARASAQLRGAAGRVVVEHLDQRLRIPLGDVQWVLGGRQLSGSLHLPPQQYLERGTLAAALARPRAGSSCVHRSHAVNPQHVMQCQLLRAARRC